MKSETLKQTALNELWAATDEYCAALNPFNKQRFIATSLRLHIARGGDVPKVAIKASRQQINKAA